MTVHRCGRRLLIFNPNTSVQVTESFKPILSQLNLPDTELIYWTCPTGPTLIRTQADMFESASHCLPLLLSVADQYDGFLGACYADHPIVRLLQSYVVNKVVVGIFDASVLAASHLTNVNSSFGILTTGLPFEQLLADGVYLLLKDSTQDIRKHPGRFAGVVASGIGADDLGAESKARARAKVVTATKKLVMSGQVGVVCVGGVILAGMEQWIREACEEELGPGAGREVKIIEQLTVGMLVLDALLRRQTECDFTPALR